MSTPVHITCCYVFAPIEEERLPGLREELLEFGTTRNMRGLVLVATEGLNATVCGSPQAITEWKAHVTGLLGDVTFKDSTAQHAVFKRWSVKIKPEIVALKAPEIFPTGQRGHLSPAEWHTMLQNDDVVVIDTRNDYEVAIGAFRNAVNPGIQKFHQFPAYVRRGAIPKDKKVLLYCTGGIRCEKAVYAMEREGYTNVYQLDGGILAYLEQFPHGAFHGECFVFDQRVAVNQDLQPSTMYSACTACGQPAAERREVCNKCEMLQTTAR